MPLSYSAVTSFIPDPLDHPRIVPGITRALRAEVEELVRQIPPGELAIQWDLAVENRHLEPALAEGGTQSAVDIAARMAAPAAEISAAIPPDVALGYHSCYGTLDGWPAGQPPDVTGSVLPLNACIEASGRSVEYLHMPTLAAATADYFAPLRDLNVADSRLYLGAIHHMHDADGLKAQIDAVRAHIPDFGLAAPCGFGRAPERPGELLGVGGNAPLSELIQIVLADHRAAAEFL